MNEPPEYWEHNYFWVQYIPDGVSDKFEATWTVGCKSQGSWELLGYRGSFKDSELVIGQRIDPPK